MWFPFSFINLRTFPATFCAPHLQGSHAQSCLPLHPRLYFLGHPVPFLVIITVIALRLNPSLRNDSSKSVSNSCYCFQNCLWAFGVFVLMECEKCAQGSRCGITHRIRCRRAQDPAPGSGSSQAWQHKLLWFFRSFLLSRSSLIIPGFFGHYIFFPVLYSCLSGLLIILFHTSFLSTSLSKLVDFHLISI